MISIGTMIKRIVGMAGTDDLTTWEDSFVLNLDDITKGGTDTSRLSEKQVAAVEKIHSKHFGDH